MIRDNIGIDADVQMRAIKAGLDRETPFVGGCAFAAGIVGFILTVIPATRLPGWFAMLPLLGLPILTIVILSLVRHRRTERSINHSLRGHGANICDSCGYSFCGVEAADRCPERGAATADMVEIGSLSDTPKPSPIEMPKGKHDR